MIAVNSPEPGREAGGRRLEMPRPVEKSVGYRIDKAISALFPGWGTRRIARRRAEYLQDLRYRAASRALSHFSGTENPAVRQDRWIGGRQHIDSMLFDDLPDMQERMNELVRDNPIASSAIEGRVAYEVGTGIRPQPRVKSDLSISQEMADAINEGLMGIYERWERFGVDKSRQFSMAQFQKQVDRCYATYGECFVLFGQAASNGPLSLAMEIIEPERVETPPDKAGDQTVRLGVQYSAEGVVLGYWVRQRHPQDHKMYDGGSWKWDYYPRFNENGTARMVHIFDPILPNQSRGIPWLAQVINRIKDLNDYWEAEVVNKEVEACFGLIVTTGEDSPAPIDVAENNASGTDSRGNRIESHSPGQVHYAAPGQSVSVVDPKRPGTTFAPFVEWSLRSIAASLNYPYELLAKNFYRVTYSSGRLAMLDGRMGFRCRVQPLIDMWLCHVWSYVVFESSFRELVEVDFTAYSLSKHTYERHLWRGQHRGLLDPEKENRAHAVGLDAEIETKAGIAGDRGENWEDNEEQLLVEGRARVAREVELATLRRELEQSAGLEPGSSEPGGSNAPQGEQPLGQMDLEEASV